MILFSIFFSIKFIENTSFESTKKPRQIFGRGFDIGWLKGLSLFSQIDFALQRVVKILDLRHNFVQGHVVSSLDSF